MAGVNMAPAPSCAASDDGSSAIEEEDDDKYTPSFGANGDRSQHGSSQNDSSWLFGSKDAKLGESPVEVTPDALLGSMPKSENTRKEGPLRKLTSKFEWREMRVVLTDDALHFAKLNEDVLRDMIPLLEIVKVKKVRAPPSAPGNFQGFCSAQSPHHTESACENIDPADAAFSKSVLLIQTAEGGYNSGRSYFLNAGGTLEREEWVGAIKSARSARARHSSPSVFRGFQSRVHAFYHGRSFQTAIAALIFSCFLANVVQLEYQSTFDIRYTYLEQVHPVSSCTLSTYSQH